MIKHEDYNTTQSLDVIPEGTKKEFFHDTQEPGDAESHSYFDPDTQQIEYPKYYDPGDKITMKVLHGRAIPLSIYSSIFIRKNELDHFVNNLQDSDLYGRDIPFDTFTYINENNIYAMANKAELMNDIDIQDQDYPTDDKILGVHNTTNDNHPVENIKRVPAMATMHRLKKENNNWELLQEKLAFFLRMWLLKLSKELPN